MGLLALVGVETDGNVEVVALVDTSFAFNNTTGEVFWIFWVILADIRFVWGAGDVAELLLLLVDGPETYYHWFGPTLSHYTTLLR